MKKLLTICLLSTVFCSYAGKGHQRKPAKSHSGSHLPVMQADSATVPTDDELGAVQEELTTSAKQHAYAALRDGFSKVYARKWKDLGIEGLPAVKRQVDFSLAAAVADGVKTVGKIKVGGTTYTLPVKK